LFAAVPKGRAQFNAGSLRVSRPGPNSRNPDALYVHSNGTYVGKISNGWFIPIHGLLPTDSTQIATELQEIADDPRGVAIRHGKATGICCCCGRELTDPQSIAAGIGPICADKWGF